MLAPWQKHADKEDNSHSTVADFFQWCAEERLKPNQTSLGLYAEVSGLNLEDYQNISALIDSLGMSEGSLEILKDASRRFWAMPAEDAYDQNPNEDQQSQIDAPLRENTSGKWYHVSPHKMEPDTVISPGGSQGPYSYKDDSVRPNWVWMDRPEAVEKWYYGTLLGQIQQGNDNPWAHIYEVEPHEGPYAWNGSGVDGHVSPSARIIREIKTDKYNRLPKEL